MTPPRSLALLAVSLMKPTWLTRSSAMSFRKQPSCGHTSVGKTYVSFSRIVPVATSMKRIFGGHVLSAAAGLSNSAKYLRPTSLTHITPPGSISMPWPYSIFQPSCGSLAAHDGHGLRSGAPLSSCTSMLSVDGTPVLQRGMVGNTISLTQRGETCGPHTFSPVITLCSGTYSPLEMALALASADGHANCMLVHSATIVRLLVVDAAAAIVERRSASLIVTTVTVC